MERYGTLIFEVAERKRNSLGALTKQDLEAFKNSFHEPLSIARECVSQVGSIWMKRNSARKETSVCLMVLLW